MPFPISKVRKLSDFNGLFSLSVTCRRCRHGRTIPAEMLARYIGASGLVGHAVSRLRCSKCDGRDHEIWVVDIPR